MSNHPRHTISRRSVLQAGGAFALPALFHDSSAPSLHATTGREQTGTAAFLELMQYVDKRMEDIGVPSVGVAVVGGDIRHTCALGITSIDDKGLADAESMFRVGPLSGLFTGSAIGALIDSGVLTLDDPISAYLPSFARQRSVASPGVTIRNLVTYQTGWQGDLPTDQGDGGEALSRYVEALAAAQPIAQPGEYFSYGRSDGILAGHLVAEITGLPFEEAVRELTLSPLSMEHSSFRESDIRALQVVDGHTRHGGEVTTVDPLGSSRAAVPVSGLFTNLNEILHFASFHAYSSTPPTFISAPIREMMHRPLESAGSVGPLRIDAMGMNWMISEFGGTRISLQVGSDRGQSAMMAAVPSERFAVVVLANADFAQHLVIEIAFRALDLFTGLRPPSSVALSRPDTELNRLVGTYLMSGDTVISVTAHDIGLQLETLVAGTVAEGMSGALTFVSPLTGMITTSGSTLFVDFVLDKDGDVGWLRHMGQLAARNSEREP